MSKRMLPVFALLFSLLLSLVHPGAVRALTLSHEWEEVDSPTSQMLFAISVADDTFFAVGENGTVVYSEDGDSWQKGDSGTSNDLYDVAAISDTKAVAVGEDGIIIRTTDGGETWEEADVSLSGSAASDDLRAVVMASASIGFAVGENGTALKTLDGGETWTKMNGLVSLAEASLNSIAVISSSRAWVTGEDGVIYATENGGIDWEEQNSGTSQNLVTITFANAANGWASGENRTFLRTVNGGSTWSKVTISELDNTDTINDVSFVDGDQGMLASAEGTFLKTDDGGLTWDEVEMDGSGSSILLDIATDSADEWWSVSEDGTIYQFDEGTYYDSSAPEKPTDFDVTGNNSHVTDTTPTFTWTASETNGADIDYYMFKVDSGSYRNVGDVEFKVYLTPLDDGDHTAYLYAVDEDGNESDVARLSFTVDEDYSGGSSGSLEISSVTPSTALKNETVTFSVRIEDTDEVDSCYLYIDGDKEKSMSVKIDMAYTTYKFTSTGTYDLEVRCEDESGDTSTGNETSVKVSTGSDDYEPGDIIKIRCTGNVYVNDPCTAVYYYGVDGKRHAFPNETVFKTWFDDYDGLIELSSTKMADISVGRNVTYRPGSSLVMFSTSSVYAVSYGGILRPIKSATIAKAIFGSDWVSEIDTVNDAFYGNYRFGSLIETSSDYSKTAVEAVTNTIDETF